MRQYTRQRRGFAAVLAMIFLVLMAVIAVGFTQQSMLSAQVARNESDMATSQNAAESGMQWVKYQLGAISLPWGTNKANVLSRVATQLGTALNGTPNMGGKTVAVTSGTIYLPSQTTWITLDPVAKTRFQATITQIAGTTTLVVTVHGMAGTSTVTRGVQMSYQPSTGSYGLMGLSSMSMSLNSYTDSYDATQGAYSAATAHKKGSIASNGNIVLSNNAKVNGDARAGVGMTTTTLNSATVTGRNAPLTQNYSMPSVTLPATYSTLPDINMVSGSLSVPGGVYVINNITLGGTAHITWTGPTILYIRNSYTVTGNVIIDTYQNLPSNRTLNFLPTCTTATWSGGGAGTNVCVGELYAPDTTFNISGQVEMFGRITAKVLNNSSSGGMHSDESLPTPGGTGSYSAVQTSYAEVP
jgi:Tfp pilus assembly protein PilX